MRTGGMRHRRQRTTPGDLGRVHRRSASSGCAGSTQPAGQHRLHHIFNLDRTTGICPMPARSSSTTPRPADRPTPLGGVRKGAAGGKRGSAVRARSASRHSAATPTEGQREEAHRDAFRDGDVWFNTGDVMRPQGLRHAAFADPPRRHVPVEGRGTSRPRRWKPRWRPTRRSRSAPCSVWRFPTPAAGRGWRRSGARRRQFDGIGWPRRCDPAHLPRSCCSSGSSTSWEATAPSRAARSTCANKAYGEHIDDPLFVLGGHRRTAGITPTRLQVAAGEGPKLTPISICSARPADFHSAFVTNSGERIKSQLAWFPCSRPSSANRSPLTVPDHGHRQPARTVLRPRRRAPDKAAMDAVRIG